MLALIRCQFLATDLLIAQLPIIIILFSLPNAAQSENLVSIDLAESKWCAGAGELQEVNSNSTAHIFVNGTVTRPKCSVVIADNLTKRMKIIKNRILLISNNTIDDSKNPKAIVVLESRNLPTEEWKILKGVGDYATGQYVRFTLYNPNEERLILSFELQSTRVPACQAYEDVMMIGIVIAVSLLVAFVGIAILCCIHLIKKQKRDKSLRTSEVVKTQPHTL